MALNVDNEIPEWKNEGAEPSEELREKGFTGGYKPPATVFNWFWSLVQKCVSELQSKLKSHADSTNNPHNVTKAQVGLGNVDNTSDVNKPVSNAVQTALDDKADNGHTHTLDDISETISKKIMTAAERSKLNGIATGANKTVVDSTLSNTSTNPVQNKVVKAEFDFIYNDKLAPMEEDISGLNNNKANKSEIPTALKNPYALTVKVGNEENPTSYDGSSSVSISVDTTPTENSNNLITSGGVYDVLNMKYKIYVGSTQTPICYKQSDGIIVNSLQEAFNVVNADNEVYRYEIILLPGSHDLPNAISLSKEVVDLTVRGFNSVNRDNCIINYTKQGDNNHVALINITANYDNLRLTLKDLTLNTNDNGARCINLSGCSGLDVDNVFFIGGNSATSSITKDGIISFKNNGANILRTVNISNCIFNNLKTNSNSYCVSIGTVGEQGKPCFIRLCGNICITEDKNFDYLLPNNLLNSVITDYGNNSIVTL